MRAPSAAIGKSRLKSLPQGKSTPDQHAVGAASAAIIAAPLLAWWDQHARKNLPWQHNPTAYRVWVSEVILQPTTVKTAAPYYEAFLERFPTLQALAEGPEEHVLARAKGEVRMVSGGEVDFVDISPKQTVGVS